MDNFGVKTPTIAAAQHLIDSLEEMYELHKDWTGKKYLGYNIKYDDREKELIMDMPHYVPHMIHQFYPDGPPKGKRSPAVYLPPRLGKQSQAPTQEDSSVKLNEKLN